MESLSRSAGFPARWWLGNVRFPRWSDSIKVGKITGYSIVNYYAEQY
jgi:hypothetical protein